MSRNYELIVELASGHGGDIDLAKRMIDAAVGAGADTVKTQAYLPESVNLNDPQAAWLKQSALTEDQHRELKAHAEAQGSKYLASVFDEPSAAFIVGLCGEFKVAATESNQHWWVPRAENVKRVCVSWIFGDKPNGIYYYRGDDLTAIPLYPTPLEAIKKATILDGWSDHCVGLAGCLYALAHGARIIEVHLTIPGARVMPWDKTPEQVAELRTWMDEFETIQTGVSQQFRERWVR